MDTSVSYSGFVKQYSEQKPKEGNTQLVKWSINKQELE